MADPIHTLSAGPRRSAHALGAVFALLAVASCVELNVAEPGRTAAVRVMPDTVNLRIGDSTQLRAAPVDEANTLLAHEPVLWTSSTAAVATVNASGLVRGVGSGVVIITATAGTVEGSAVAIISGAPTAVASAAGDAQTAGVNEFVAIPPTVRVSDAQGNGVYAVPVTFAVTAGGGSISVPQPVLTDVNGLASVPWRLGPVPGTNTLSATTGDPLTGSPVTFTATAEVGPPDAAASSVEAVPATIPPSAGGSASTITVTVRDALGRTVAGAAVTLAVSGTGNTLTQPGTVTDNQGRTSGTLSATVAETKTVSATVNGVLAITQTAEVVVNPGAPAAIAVITEPAGAVANAYFLTQPVVEIRDGFGNRLPTATDPVSVSLIHGDGVLASGSGMFTVNAVDGRATFSGLHVRGPRVAGDTLGLGAHVLRFSVPGLAPVESDTVRVEVSWAYNVVDVFNRGCVNCHAYTVESTVGVPVAGGPCIGRVRVVAGDSTSLLYEKMKPAPSCGSAMPFGPPMSPRQRSIVRDWIVQGARNN
jgi:hypothetical protein